MIALYSNIFSLCMSNTSYQSSIFLKSLNSIFTIGFNVNLPTSFVQSFIKNSLFPNVQISGLMIALYCYIYPLCMSNTSYQSSIFLNSLNSILTIGFNINSPTSFPSLRYPLRLKNPESTPSTGLYKKAPLYSKLDRSGPWILIEFGSFTNCLIDAFNASNSVILSDLVRSSELISPRVGI